MYVRWKRYVRIGKSGERATRSASLVESVRVEGKPRQRTIAYLAAADDAALARGEVLARGLFWWRAVLNLDTCQAFARLNAEDRAAIEQSMMDVVPPLSKTEHERWVHEYAGRYGYPPMALVVNMYEGGIPCPLGPRGRLAPNP